MSLPNLPAGDKFRREVRTEWGGLNLNENAGDGELIEAMNMSSREFPVLSTERLMSSPPAASIKLDPYVYEGKLGYIRKNGTNNYSFYDPTTGGGFTSILLSDGDIDKVGYALMRDRMVILPGKDIYDFSAHSLSPIRKGIQDDVILRNSAADISTEANAVQVSDSGLLADFSPGDAVTISGCTVHPENNKTAIIREISGDKLIFYDNTFRLNHKWRFTVSGTMAAGTYHFYAGDDPKEFTLSSSLGNLSTILYAEGAGTVSVAAAGGPAYTLPVSEGTGGAELTVEQLNDSYQESSVDIVRDIPDMDFICVNENRLWGCKGDTIYASKLGDPLNFSVFDGLSTDSWSAETGTPGEFTGCCSFQGYPTFFKEGRVFKVLGDEPKSFTLRPLNIVGAAAGDHKSIVEIRGKLYYVSTVGVVEWNGGDYPQTVSGELGRTPGCFVSSGARAGTDGVRYFVYLYRYGIQYTFLPDGGQSRGLGTLPHLYVYDPRYGTWHELACTAGSHAPDFAGDGSSYYMLQHDVKTAGGIVYDRTVEYSLSRPGTQFEAPDWSVTFADSTRAYKTALTGSESKKGVLRLLIRCRLAGSMKVWISYDGGRFEEAGEFGGENGMAKGSRVIPLILRRCDFWQLRLTGTGDAVICSIAVERYGGEWQQA